MPRETYTHLINYILAFELPSRELVIVEQTNEILFRRKAKMPNGHVIKISFFIKTFDSPIYQEHQLLVVYLH